MRSKMLGLAIALSTFGLGVAATTAWISSHTNQVRGVHVSTGTVLVPRPASAIAADDFDPCQVSSSSPGSSSIITPYVNAPIDGGVLNGKGISEPTPAYPEKARAAQASGAVIIEVMTDKCGYVVMAKAVTGHALLRQAAVDAAMNWRFAPTLLSGHRVRVKGTIAFNFLLQ
ncbi:MAG: energy transducer TonB [Pyrinomonadaceae bacterium]